MQTYKLELINSERVELYIANIILDYRRKFESLQERLTVIVESLISSDTYNLCSPTVRADLIEKQKRITQNISDLNASLERSRKRYAEIQSSLIECEKLIERIARFIERK